MTARGTIRPGVRRANGYTWYCPWCPAAMESPPVGVEFGVDAMWERERIAERSWRAHVLAKHDGPPGSYAASLAPERAP